MLKPSLRHPSRSSPALSLRLERWQRRAIYFSVGLLTVSGVLWLAAHFFWRPVTQFGEGVSPLEPWSMKLHGAATLVFLFLVGTMLNTHIRRALRGRRNLISGWAMIGSIGCLALSGYGLYYLASENARPIWSSLHWIIGIGFAVGIVLHVFFGRRSLR